MKKLISIATLIISTSIYASQPQCPSINEIRAVHFSDIKQLVFSEWIAYTFIKSQGGEYWFVGADLGTDLKGKSPEEALKYSNEYIKTVPLMKPEIQPRDHEFDCIYNHHDFSFQVTAAKFTGQGSPETASREK